MTGPREEQGEWTIDVAADWAFVRFGECARLFDFRINRAFDITAQGFISHNLAANPAFLIYELQNRSILMRTIGAIGDVPFDACDAQSEMGLMIPAMGDRAETRLRSTRGGAQLECNGRDAGRYEAGEGAAPPAALWPTMAHVMRVHPALREHMAASGRAPRLLESRYRLAPGLVTQTWRLTAAEAVETPYPLTESRANVTATAIDDAVTSPGFGALAAEAVAGRALGGPPTWVSLNAQLRRTREERGAVAAALDLFSYSAVFPDFVERCVIDETQFACALIREFGALVGTEPALRGYMTIMQAERTDNLSIAVPAMAEVRQTPFRDHPAILASFALALAAGGGELQQQAQAAGVPHEPIPLQVTALRVMPYAPSYWTDIGDTFVRELRYPEAFLFYDIAAALPVDSARNLQGPVARPVNLASRIRTDFPYFFLGQ
ncbi:MAG: hypothetical protein AB7T08_01725 [Hyphomonadaceae bacterium]